MRLHHLVEKGTDEDTMRKERETMMEEVSVFVYVISNHHSILTVGTF